MKKTGKHQRKVNRRKFILKAAAIPLWGSTLRETLSAAQPKMKIRRIEIFPARYPMTGHFKFFTGPHGSL